jgi:hypothetical protein
MTCACGAPPVSRAALVFLPRPPKAVEDRGSGPPAEIGALRPSTY